MTTTTTTTITMETINSGKCQFNAKSAKKLRDTLAKYHDARCTIANELALKQDRVKALSTVIDTDKQVLAKIANAQPTIDKRSETEIQSEIDSTLAKIEHENNAMSELRNEQVKRLEFAENLVSKELYNAYVNAITTNELDAYFVAIAEFLSKNGVEPCMDSIKALAYAVGKATNNGKKLVRSNGVLNSAKGFKAWRSVFLCELCDIMGDTIPKFKFTYVLKDKRNK